MKKKQIASFGFKGHPAKVKMWSEGTPLTEREQIVLSAWFARSNMGMERASRKEVEDLLSAKHEVTLQGATVRLCQQFMETNEHERMFVQEAKSWHKDFRPSRKYATREAVLKTWPDVKPYFWPEEKS